MRSLGRSDKDNVLNLSLENHQLQQIVYKYKKDNIDLRKRVDDQNKQIEQFKDIIYAQKSKVEDYKFRMGEFEGQVNARDEVIDKLQRIMRQLNQLKDDSQYTQHDRTPKLVTGDRQSSSLNPNKNMLRLQEHMKNDSYGPKLSSVKVQHKQYKRGNDKLPAIYTQDQDDNLAVMKIPKKQLKPIDKFQLAHLIQQQQV